MDIHLIAAEIRGQIEKGQSIRKIGWQLLQQAQHQPHIQGIKLKCSGRLNGVALARSQVFQKGQLPLQTLQARVDYRAQRVLTPSGYVGFKLWICYATSST